VLQRVAEGGGPVRLQDLCGVAPGGEDHGCCLVGDREQDAVRLDRCFASSAVAIKRDQDAGLAEVDYAAQGGCLPARKSSAAGCQPCIPRGVRGSDGDGVDGTVEGVLAGNAGRQRMLRRPGAPTYEVIVDEMAIRRLAAPPDIVKKQLYHLATTCNGKPAVALRVLPVQARLDSFTVPRCAFSIYTYPDPGDPAVVAIDTVTSDLVLTEPAEVAPYEQLYARLRAAALPPPPTASTCSPRQPPASPTTNPGSRLGPSRRSRRKRLS
jgi:Domain of unknown function (DUF5753)